MLPNNLLLAALPKSYLVQLRPKLEKIELIYRSNIYTAGDVIKDVYFPESGIISLLAVIGKDSTIEVGIVGSEGMAGLALFLGVKTSSNRAVVQGAGYAMRMSAADFLFESGSRDEFGRALRRFSYSLMTQISQSAVCNRFHPIDARLARWLMMTRDRMRSDKFQITQEFLSNMLGVRREAVNKAASKLNDQGLISYVRGHLTIVDAPSLKKHACACYQVILDDLVDRA